MISVFIAIKNKFPNLLNEIFINLNDTLYNT